MQATWSACTQTLEGHGSSVRSVAFSADGRHVVSGSADKTIKIWDCETGTCTQTLEGHGDWVRSVAFSADGRHVVSGSDDQTIKIWDCETGTCTRTLDVGRVTTILAVESSHPLILHVLTDRGGLDIKLAKSRSNELGSDRQYMDQHKGEHSQGYGLSTNGMWVTWNHHNMLKIPPDYRPTCSVIWKKGQAGSGGLFNQPCQTSLATQTFIVAIGCNSGRVVILGLLKPC